MRDWLADRSPVERQIVGALKSAVDAHGPLTRANLASAAHRVYAALRSYRRQFLSDPKGPAMRMLDTTLLTRDEECCAESRIASAIQERLERLKFDTYNHEYVVRVTVDVLDEQGNADGIAEFSG